VAQGNLAFSLWISRIDAIQRKKLIELRLIRFAVLLKITPSPRDGRAGVKDDYALIMTWRGAFCTITRIMPPTNCTKRSACN
jgi:hypothetical protein